MNKEDIRSQRLVQEAYLRLSQDEAIRMGSNPGSVVSVVLHFHVLEPLCPFSLTKVGALRSLRHQKGVDADQFSRMTEMVCQANLRIHTTQKDCKAILGEIPTGVSRGGHKSRRSALQRIPY